MLCIFKCSFLFVSELLNKKKIQSVFFDENLLVTIIIIIPLI